MIQKCSLNLATPFADLLHICKTNSSNRFIVVPSVGLSFVAHLQDEFVKPFNVILPVDLSFVARLQDEFVKPFIVVLPVRRPEFCCTPTRRIRQTVYCSSITGLSFVAYLYIKSVYRSSVCRLEFCCTSAKRIRQTVYCSSPSLSFVAHLQDEFVNPL
jgi:hypothetical protein